MAGTYVVDTAATFSKCILMGVTAKLDFDDPNRQATDANGQLKWEAECAVTFTPDRPGARVMSELIRVTLTGDTDPGAGIPEGPCVLDGLRVGVSAPEARTDGRVRGGRFWFSAVGIRSAVPARSRGGDS